MLSSSLRRSTFAVARAARPSTRAFSRSAVMLSSKHSGPPKEQTVSNNIQEVDGVESLFGPGGKPNTVPTDFEQATGLERLELLGKLTGVDIFDTEPLDASRKGTIEDPVIIDSYDHERYVGCTGSPAGSHEIQWLRPRSQKVARCWECGSVYKLNYIGVGEPPHHH